MNFELTDEQKMIQELARKIADEKINVRDLRVVARGGHDTAVLKIVVEVSDIYDLKKIMSSITRVGDVLNVFRSGKYKRATVFKKRTKNE